MYNDGIVETATNQEVKNKVAEIFFKNEKCVRQKNNMSQKDMADLMEIHSQSLSAYERGSWYPSDLYGFIDQFADLMGLDPSVLVMEDFAERYDPSVLKNAEPPKETAVKLPSDYDITVLYLMKELEAASKLYFTLQREIEEAYSKMQGFRAALRALGKDVIDVTEEGDEIDG